VSQPLFCVVASAKVTNYGEYAEIVQYLPQPFG
jgi:hypothetical protein